MCSKYIHVTSIFYTHGGAEADPALQTTTTVKKSKKIKTKKQRVELIYDTMFYIYSRL